METIMRQHPTIRFLLFLVSTLIIQFGCIPQIQRETPTSPITKPAPVISLQELEKRSSSLKRLLDSGELDQVQRETASTLLEAYEKIHNVSMNRQDPASTREVAEIIFDCLGKVEGKAVQKAQDIDMPGRILLKHYDERKKKIFDDYFYGNDQGVIDEVVDLEQAYGAPSLTPEIGLVFAVSLARKGMLKEALDVSERLLAKLEGMPDQIYLRAKMIEWHLGLGNRVGALRTYEKLIDRMDERKSIFEEAQRTVFQNKEKGPVEQPEGQAFPEEGANFGHLPVDSLDQLIDEVNRLIDRHDYHDAKLLIIRRKLRAQDDSETAILDKTFQRVEKAELSYQGQNISLPPTPPEKDPLELARILIEEEKFEQALEYINGLEEIESAAPQAEELRAYATERIIHRERYKAAELYLRAGKTEDEDKKREYLVLSYNILKNLIDKYPLSSLNKKINDNLKTVENELSKFGIVPP